MWRDRNADIYEHDNTIEEVDDEFENTLEIDDEHEYKVMGNILNNDTLKDDSALNLLMLEMLLTMPAGPSLAFIMLSRALLFSEESSYW